MTGRVGRVRQKGRRISVRTVPVRRIVVNGMLLVGFVLVLAVGGALALRYWVDRRYKPRIYTSIEDVPPRRVAIVFGAGVWPDGRLSDILADRVETAVALYQAGKVRKLLMTGDNRFINYNEPQHMKEYAMARGVPEEDIVLDYAGRRTYDSCYRARAIFGVQEAILVTQNYHLDRALFTCNGLGVDAIGVVADRRPYVRARTYWWREVPAVLLAWWQVKVTRPEPILGEPIPIGE